MAKKRGGLGRGLESLFEDTAPSFESDNRIETLPLREIEPDPAQPRKTFDEETLAELAASISEHGLLQPIAVRPHGVDRYLIVAGERRWRACRMAGLTEAPVVVKDVTDEQAMELALVENLQREDLDPVEEALGIRELMTRCDLTQEQAARKLGKSRSALANSLRLLNLPETVLELLKSGFLTTGHAKVVLGLPTPELHRSVPFAKRRELKQCLKSEIAKAYADGYRYFYCGMAMGFDLLAAEAALSLQCELKDLQVIAVVPFRGQSDRWSKEEQAKYDAILRIVDDVVVLSEQYYNGCLLRRNDYMVNRSSRLIAYFDGNPKGGTFYTVREAKRQGLDIVNLHNSV